MKKYFLKLYRENSMPGPAQAGAPMSEDQQVNHEKIISLIGHIAAAGKHYGSTV